ncbi:unnamed protein product [Vitrella brassicaformis CCMP3155]|uniref:DAAF9 N-terminal domain-containing protein n=2 Tax=Vitrella brassicaformis TaxID=1169539 RepID=A0A0G4GBQ8_VITBC|nr:unnamed protein product [Vitrella brassicaformis CCMP3155]|eukprot:CEM26272.1 unnamed protein product [Vitrella brassicaformis CCMP3155]
MSLNRACELFSRVVSSRAEQTTGAAPVGRLVRVKQLLDALELDALLLILGYDGHENDGSRALANYLLNGKCGRRVSESLDIQYDDVFCVISATRIVVFCPSSLHDPLTQRLALWPGCEIVSPSAEVEADSSAFEALKVACFLDAVRGVKAVGIPIHPDQVSEIEQWPLIQSYAYDDFHLGFFSATKQPKGVLPALRATLFAEWDLSSLSTTINGPLPFFTHAWQQTLAALDSKAPEKRAACRLSQLVEPLTSHFAYALMEGLPEGVVNERMTALSKRVAVNGAARAVYEKSACIGEGEATERGETITVGSIPGPTHLVLHASDPATGCQATRTYFIDKEAEIDGINGDKKGGDTRTVRECAYLALISALGASIAYLTKDPLAQEKTLLGSTEDETRECLRHKAHEKVVEELSTQLAATGEDPAKPADLCKDFSLELEVFDACGLRVFLSPTTKRPPATLLVFISLTLGNADDWTVSYGDSFFITQPTEGRGMRAVGHRITASIPCLDRWTLTRRSPHISADRGLGNTIDEEATGGIHWPCLQLLYGTTTSSRSPAPVFLPLTITGSVRAHERGYIVSSHKTGQHIIRLDELSDIRMVTMTQSSSAARHGNVWVIGSSGHSDPLSLRYVAVSVPIGIARQWQATQTEEGRQQWEIVVEDDVLAKTTSARESGSRLVTRALVRGIQDGLASVEERDYGKAPTLTEVPRFRDEKLRESFEALCMATLLGDNHSHTLVARARRQWVSLMNNELPTAQSGLSNRRNLLVITALPGSNSTSHLSLAPFAERVASELQKRTRSETVPVVSLDDCGDVSIKRAEGELMKMSADEGSWVVMCLSGPAFPCRILPVLMDNQEVTKRVTCRAVVALADASSFHVGGDASEPCATALRHPWLPLPFVPGWCQIVVAAPEQLSATVDELKSKQATELMLSAVRSLCAGVPIIRATNPSHTLVSQLMADGSSVPHFHDPQQLLERLLAPSITTSPNETQAKVVVRRVAIPFEFPILVQTAKERLMDIVKRPVRMIVSHPSTRPVSPEEQDSQDEEEAVLLATCEKYKGTYGAFKADLISHSSDTVYNQMQQLRPSSQCSGLLSLIETSQQPFPPSGLSVTWLSAAEGCHPGGGCKGEAIVWLLSSEREADRTASDLERAVTDAVDRCRLPLPSPPTPVKATDLSEAEHCLVASKCDTTDLPEGWWWDGSRYVDLFDHRSTRHPKYDEYAEAYLCERNGSIAVEQKALVRLQRMRDKGII